MAAPNPLIILLHTRLHVSNMAAGRWRQKGFYISETVVIFIMKLIEMCVRLRSAAG